MLLLQITILNVMILPPLLKTGDKVRILAPARKISEDELKPSIFLFESNGLRVNLGKNIFKQYHQFAGTDQERISDFQEALNNPDIKAIFCARGGYGTLRIIDKLDFSLFKKHPKWICGYSDVSVLHSHLHCLGFASLHATMPININNEIFDSETIKTMIQALFTGNISYTIPPHPFNKTGKADGFICGGNLSLLYALNGSASDIDTKNKILFIEELDEYLYHIDRMMLCLKRSHKLSYLSALIIGGMTQMNDNTIAFGKTAEEIILEHVQSFNYPVCFGFPAGHIIDNRAIIFGKKSFINITDNNVILTI